MEVVQEGTLYPMYEKELAAFSMKNDKLEFIELILNFLTLIKCDKVIMSTKKTKSDIISHRNKNGKIIIFTICNVSRIIFCSSDSKKIFSVYFPFVIMVRNDHPIMVFYGDEDISVEKISFLKSILNNFKKDLILNKSELIDEIKNEFIDYLAEYENEDGFFENMLKIFKNLLSLDTGYIRYDCDKVNSTEHHPTNHLDVFYSKDSSIKIGLRNEYKLCDFLSILSNKESIKYLVD